MEWIDAENEIRRLLPTNRLLSFGYKKDVWPEKMATVEFHVTAVFDKQICIRFEGLSWSEIIKKIKIWNVPAEIGNDKEPAEEGQAITQQTQAAICDYCTRENHPSSGLDGNCCEFDRFTGSESNNPCFYCQSFPCENPGCDGYNKFIG